MGGAYIVSRPRIGVSRAQCCSGQDRDSAAGIRARAAVVFVPTDGGVFYRRADERDSVRFGLTVGCLHGFLHTVIEFIMSCLNLSVIKN
ncbi:uncharacterized [Tachysurus ichikawai]